MRLRSQIFLAILLLFAKLYSQTDTINQLDRDSLKQGYWKKYKNLKGQNINILTEEGRYLYNKTGVWKEYYNNGTIKNIITFKNGKPEGLFTCYQENGKIIETGIWKNNRWVEEHILYYDSGKILNYDRLNEKGKKEGKQQSYYQNGNLKYECWYTAGVGDSCYFYKEDGKFDRKDYFPSSIFFHDDTSKFNDSIIKKIKN